MGAASLAPGITFKAQTTLDVREYTNGLPAEMEAPQPRPPNPNRNPNPNPMPKPNPSLHPGPNPNPGGLPRRAAILRLRGDLTLTLNLKH